MSARRGMWLKRALIPFLTIPVLLAGGVVAVPIQLTAVAQPGGVTLLTPALVRANGPTLRWTPFSGTGFPGYEVHRSATPGFTPSAATRLTVIRDHGTTGFVDTTAAPAKTFHYRLLTGTTAGNEIAVSTPPAGQARLTVTAADGSGAATYVAKDGTAPAGCHDWQNYGTAAGLRVGADANGTVHRALLRFDLRDVPIGAQILGAQLDLAYGGTAANPGQLDVHRITKEWTEGSVTGVCDGSGASWLETKGGVRWNQPGVDMIATASASVPAKSRGTAGRDIVDLAGLVRQWTGTDAANHGLLIKAASEAVPASGANWFDYRSDDTAEQPRLTITFVDAAAAGPPVVRLTSPRPDQIVETGEVTLTAQAGDDSRVTRVDFLVNGKVVGSDTGAPYEWRHTFPAGDHTVAVTAVDDAGNAGSAKATALTVHPPVQQDGSVVEPAGDAVVAGRVWVVGVGNFGWPRFNGGMQVLVDGIAVDFTQQCGEVDIGLECIGTWDTTSPLSTWEDGAHEISMRQVRFDGRASAPSAVVRVVLNNDGPRPAPGEGRPRRDVHFGR